MIVVVYDAATGAARSIGSVPPDPVPTGLAVFTLDAPYATQGDYAWDADTRTLTVRPAPVLSVLSRLQFRWRYTLAEQVAIELAERTHEDATVRATLAVLRQSLTESTEINVTDPRTIQGVQYHASIGLIAPSRVAEILAPGVT